MRPDQRKRLAELSEKLIDVVLEEADPDFWPGAGKALADVDQETRGNRYWCKKNASATFALANSVEKLCDNTKQALGRDPYQGADLEAEIRRAEKLAGKMLDKVNKQHEPRIRH
jgi:hypothetical protein